VAVAPDEVEHLRRRRWLLGGVIAVTLAILTLMLFSRVPTTEVEIELVASEIELAVPTRQVVLYGTPLATLGVDGVTRVDAPTDDQERPLVPDLSSDPPSAIRFVAGPAGPPDAARTAGSVTLGELVAPAGARLRLAVANGGASHRISLHGAGVSVPVTLQGSVVIGTNQSPPGERTYSTPRLVSLDSADELILDLGWADQSRGASAPVIDVDGLSANRIDQHVDASGSVVRPVSTIQSGSVYLTSLDDRLRKLRTGEVLVLGGAHGEIASLAFTDAGVAVRFRGRVSDMTVGWGEHPRSLMPTWLEWSQAQHGLTLLWGSVIYFLGVLATVMRLWGVKV